MLVKGYPGFYTLFTDGAVNQNCTNINFIAKTLLELLLNEYENSLFTSNLFYLCYHTEKIECDLIPLIKFV